jgi:hypothetical protein
LQPSKKKRTDSKIIDRFKGKSIGQNSAKLVGKPSGTGWDCMGPMVFANKIIRPAVKLVNNNFGLDGWTH